jgi:hypothetical protein
MGDNCICGCSVNDHEYPGGACSGCWHCQYVEYQGHLSGEDIAALNAIEDGAGDYWRDNQRLVW